MEIIDYYDREKGKIIDCIPNKYSVWHVEKAKAECQKTLLPLSCLSVELFSNTILEDDEACKDFDAYVINELGFKLVVFCEPDFGDKTFKFCCINEAEEIKKKLVKKLKELKLETYCIHRTQTLCPNCSHDFFLVYGDFDHIYCWKCGKKLPEKGNWHYSNPWYLSEIMKSKRDKWRQTK